MLDNDIYTRYLMRHVSHLLKKKTLRRIEGETIGKESVLKGVGCLYFNCRSIINTRMTDRFFLIYI